jgi:hypothetical protein
MDESFKLTKVIDRAPSAQRLAAWPRLLELRPPRKESQWHRSVQSLSYTVAGEGLVASSKEFLSQRLNCSGTRVLGLGDDDPVNERQELSQHPIHVFFKGSPKDEKQTLILKVLP